MKICISDSKDSVDEPSSQKLVIIGGIQEKWKHHVGEAEFVEDCMELIDIDFLQEKTEIQSTFIQMPHRRFKAQAVAVMDKHEVSHIYIIGGSNIVLTRRGNTHTQNTLIRFTPSKHEWHIKKQMRRSRDTMAVFTLGQKIVTAGGWTYKDAEHYGITASVEVYDMEEDEWVSEEDMPYSLQAASGCSVGGKGYIVGGKLEGSKIPSSDIVVYNPNTSTRWGVKSGILGTGRKYHSACTHDSKIYILGGYDGRHTLDSVVCFNTTSDSITELTPMPHVRSPASAIVQNNYIYVVAGGEMPPGEKWRVTKTIFRYNILENKWDETEWSLDRPLYHHCCVLIQM